jgi:SAM-dependent methyltransferase/uncharacterized protein YbaR (Trm112 family)
MKPRLLHLLRCPICIAPLDLDVFETRGDEIVEGALTCRDCRAAYPVIESIPRMLPEDLAGEMRALNRDFFARHPGLLPQGPSAPESSESARALQRTFRSFSFQWNTFGDMYDFWEENFRDYVHPLTPEFFAGKLGCDAGCGFGRHLHYATRYGAEMVGLDLSEAVLAAYRNNGASPRAHVVQGDIYRPPFAKSTFDFVYSVGVLHHLPDPEGAFRSLAPYVKPGGTLFAWIYGPRGGVSEAVTRVLRRFTTRMDYRWLYALCVTIAATLRVGSHYPYRTLRRIPFLSRLAEKLPLHDHHRYPFKVVVADAFDRLSVPLVRYYTEENMRGWLDAAGLVDGQTLRRFRNNESWRVLGRVRSMAEPGPGPSETQAGRPTRVAVESGR